MWPVSCCAHSCAQPILIPFVYGQVRIGLLLLAKTGDMKADGFVKKLLKEWDSKGKGEVAKGEFRLHMRKLFADAKETVPSSNECDDSFDAWDEDRGGTLDHKELGQALLGCPAKVSPTHASRPAPHRRPRARPLRRHDLPIVRCPPPSPGASVEAKPDRLSEPGTSRGAAPAGAPRR